MGSILGVGYLSGVGLMIQSGTVLYASADHPDSITEAREYIKRMGLTADDVRLIRKSGSVLVIAKRDLKLRG